MDDQELSEEMLSNLDLLLDMELLANEKDWAVVKKLDETSEAEPGTKQGEAEDAK